ncbi:uncharacterized protein LOC135121261 isoform X2 [Zophobas morio]|uniref:uncharacterized protein LOC135121261 isoform X2 n=1 Tax=Zophobas morio TaxID=2755281 RepID=UPI0030830152
MGGKDPLLDKEIYRLTQELKDVVDYGTLDTISTLIQEDYPNVSTSQEITSEEKPDQNINPSFRNGSFLTTTSAATLNKLENSSSIILSNKNNLCNSCEILSSVKVSEAPRNSNCGLKSPSQQKPIIIPKLNKDEEQPCGYATMEEIDLYESLKEPDKESFSLSRDFNYELYVAQAKAIIEACKRRIESLKELEKKFKLNSDSM